MPKLYQYVLKTKKVVSMLQCQMRDINSMSSGNVLATHYHAQLGLPDKVRGINGLVV